LNENYNQFDRMGVGGMESLGAILAFWGKYLYIKNGYLTDVNLILWFKSSSSWF